MVLADIAGANMVDIREHGQNTLNPKYRILPTIVRAVVVPDRIEDPLLACTVSFLIRECPFLREIHGTPKKDVPRFLNDGYITITYSQEEQEETESAIAEIRWYKKKFCPDDSKEEYFSIHTLRVILRRKPFWEGGLKYPQLSFATYIGLPGGWLEHGTS